VPIAVAGVMLVAGMAFELFWLPVVYHQARWFTPVDVWGMFRAAHFVGWGYLGGIYTQGNDVVIVADRRLVASLRLVGAPSIKVTPAGWPWLPVFPFRIAVSLKG
jgi:hypothetical protein